MKSLPINIFIVFLTYLIISACESKPKVVEGKPIVAAEHGGKFSNTSDMTTKQLGDLNEHTVKVEEILNTERYSYLHVTEKGEKYWIAIPRKEVEIGGTYHFNGGLLKRNFESKEYNRVFETLYLVSDVIPHKLPSNESLRDKAKDKESITQKLKNIIPTEGSIRLSELFSETAKYEGKLVQVTGKCVKVNPMIMGKNWIHIQDGSGDGLDLTVTTTENVVLDAIVSFEGMIALNKDFGAGYRYDVIMENAILK